MHHLSFNSQGLTKVLHSLFQNHSHLYTQFSIFKDSKVTGQLTQVRPSPLEYIEHIKDLDLITCCHINNTDTLKKRNLMASLATPKGLKDQERKLKLMMAYFILWLKK